MTRSHRAVVGLAVVVAALLGFGWLATGGPAPATASAAQPTCGHGHWRPPCPTSTSPSPTSTDPTPTTTDPSPTTTDPSPTSTDPDCTAPLFQTSEQFGTWNYAPNILVNNNVWGPAGSWSQTLSACSPSSWYVTANFPADGGAIQSYPDTQFLLSGKSVSQYSSMKTCFGETAPIGGEWNYGYDVWINNYGIEVMVWNDWTDTGIYPPATARAVTIDGIAYHTWRGGGSNEWIYTRDTLVNSGCFDMLPVLQDLVAHPSTSGMTGDSVPNALEYGVEIASTDGTGVFHITNATLEAV